VSKELDLMAPTDLALSTSSLVHLRDQPGAAEWLLELLFQFVVIRCQESDDAEQH